MFGKRYDGVKVKDIDIIEKAGPYFMPQRNDATNYYAREIDCAPVDDFVKEQKKINGEFYSYTEILIAACMRMLYERPKTNRFINDCVIYQRKKVWISITVKKSLTDDGEEVVLKMPFTGRESLPEVKKIFREELARTCATGAEVHETTKTAGFLTKLPNWLFKFAMWLVRFLDRHNCMPKSLIDASPFHTSLFITDLRSIKLDKIYHHLYNFGTTSIFVAMGKVNQTPVATKEGEIKIEKRMGFGFSLDDRICDGLYYKRSVDVMFKYFTNPSLMMERLPEPPLEGKALKKKQKQDKKLAKKQAKLDKKNAKKK